MVQNTTASSMNKAILWCHYTVQMVYVCDPVKGQAANATYLAQANVDTARTPPTKTPTGTACPTDGRSNIADGLATPLPVATTGVLDPLRPDDANWDADGDGLPNCANISGRSSA